MGERGVGVTFSKGPPMGIWTGVSCVYGMRSSHSTTCPYSSGFILKFLSLIWVPFEFHIMCLECLRAFQQMHNGICDSAGVFIRKNRSISLISLKTEEQIHKEWIAAADSTMNRASLATATDSHNILHYWYDSANMLIKVWQLSAMSLCFCIWLQ